MIDFYATWCPPCKAIAPRVAEFAKKYSNVRFYKVDVDEVSDVAQECNISAMPTFIFYKDGEVVDTIVGAIANQLEATILKLN
jgi:thioredoxin 1